jgi:hypothetical protein
MSKPTTDQRRKIMAKIPLGALRFTNPTTAALVRCSDWGFTDINGEPESESLGCAIDVRFNGLTEDAGGRVTVSRNATLAQKQTAIRTRVNVMLEGEGVTLNNANIQIENMTT